MGISLCDKFEKAFDEKTASHQPRSTYRINKAS